MLRYKLPFQLDIIEPLGNIHTRRRNGKIEISIDNDDYTDNLWDFVREPNCSIRVDCFCAGMDYMNWPESLTEFPEFNKIYLMSDFDLDQIARIKIDEFEHEYTIITKRYEQLIDLA